MPPGVCATAQKSFPFPGEEQSRSRCSSLFFYLLESQQRCAGIQMPLRSVQLQGHRERSTHGQLLSYCGFFWAKYFNSCSSPDCRGYQRDFLNKFLIPSRILATPLRGQRCDALPTCCIGSPRQITYCFLPSSPHQQEAAAIKEYTTTSTSQPHLLRPGVMLRPLHL